MEDDAPVIEQERKQVYSKPVLTELGKLESQTKGTTGIGADSLFS